LQQEVGSGLADLMGRPASRRDVISGFNRAKSKWRLLFACVVLLVLWLATRPYVGVTHDFRLYLVWALGRLNPGRLDDDLYLRFGSQDNFSIYSYLLLRIVSTVGIQRADLYLTIIGGILWMSGATILARAIFPTFLYRVAALVGVLLLPAEYSGGYPGILPFQYAEPFPSPRVFVEALILISIAWSLSAAWWRVTALLTVALVVHPLMTIPGAGIVFMIGAQRQRLLWLLPFLGIATVAGLALAGVEPFVRIGETITGEWWLVVARRCHFAFLSEWNTGSYIRIFVQANIGLLAFWFGSLTERRLLKALAAVVAIAFIASLIGADWLDNLLVINVQAGRATWLLSCIINLLAGGLLIRVFASPTPCRGFLAVGLALYALYHFVPLMTFLAFPVLAATSLALWHERRKGPIPHLMNLAILTLAGFASTAALMLVYADIALQPKSPMAINFYLNFGLVITTMYAVRLYLADYRRVSSSLVAVALIVGIANADQRSPWQRLIDTGEQPPDSVINLVKGARNIYWEEGVEFLWFDLRRPSYFSITQGTGSMFYQETALEYARRGGVLALLNTRDFGRRGDVDTIPKQDPNADGPTSVAQLERVCRALPDLDLLVLLTDLPEVQRLVWQAPQPQYLYAKNEKSGFSLKPFYTYYFYKCSDFRANSPT
jgi:hypothetical protein